MTLQTQHTVNAPATLTDEQRRRVSDALENAQSVNTRRNYAGQFRKFRAWCEREGSRRCRRHPRSWLPMPRSWSQKVRACQRSGSRSRLSLTLTGAWTWSLL